MPRQPAAEGSRPFARRPQYKPSGLSLKLCRSMRKRAFAGRTQHTPLNFFSLLGDCCSAGQQKPQRGREEWLKGEATSVGGHILRLPRSFMAGT